MQRRDFIYAAICSAASFSPNGQAHSIKQGAEIGVEEADLSVLMDKLKKESLTSLALCQFYLNRIKRFDKEGPALNSVIELNPDALNEAAVLDKERAEGKMRGPLHGIPVLIKDNIATADRMETTAGSLALVGIKPLQDAGLVVRLRKAGAIILGKTNLSEWANMRSTRSTSGWSGRDGLTLNPYALNRNCSGSSSGTGAAISATRGWYGNGWFYRLSCIDMRLGRHQADSRSGESERYHSDCTLAGYCRPYDTHGSGRCGFAGGVGRRGHA